ncbi:MAG: hypothetical protein M9962_15480 [Oligoflexia bacterium]|nr:hypothetical protein [Oligoflexia bacterium]
MMRASLFLILLSLTFGSSVYAEEVQKEESMDWQIEIDPKVYAPTEFEKKGLKTQNLAKKSHKPELPRKEERDQFFQQVNGLDAHINKLDEVDKDIFYMNAKRKSIDELKKIYPNIPSELFLKFKKIVKK